MNTKDTKHRVYRGGGGSNDTYLCMRSAIRVRDIPMFDDNELGFRCVRKFRVPNECNPR